MNRAVKHVLFDLDGTLVDPADGIIASFQLGLAATGTPVPPASTLGFVIGPPLRASFPKAGVPADKVDDALAAYRSNYRAGAMFRARIYDGIPATLAALEAAGCILHVATSKPHVFAKPILAHFGLATHFKSIHGAELDGTRDAKADVIGFLLSEQGVDASDAVMIGDTAFDVIGARAHGIATIGVAWGHGGVPVLREAGAALIVEHPEAIVPAIASAAWRS